MIKFEFPFFEMKVTTLIKQYLIVSLLFFLLILISSEFIIDTLFGDGDGIVTINYFDPIMNFSIIAISILIVILCYFKLTVSKWKQFIETRTDSKSISLIRILYILVALPMATQNFLILELLHFDSTERILILYKILNVVWILVLIIILAGWGGKIKYVLNFVLTCLLLHWDVGRDQMKIMSFFMIFLNIDAYYSIGNKQNKVSYTWPLYLIMYCHAITIFMAGFSKLLDPIWTSGLGFYYTLMQPWLKQTTMFDSLMDNRILMLILNYGTVYSELIILPLLLIKKTRIWGIGFTFLMFLMLTFVFRIDAIGPSGLVIAFIMIYCCPSTQKLLSKTLLFKNTENLKSIESSKTNRFAFIFITTLISVSLFNLVIIDAMNGKFKYPRVSYPFILTETMSNQSPSENRIEKSISYLENTLNHISSFNIIYSWYEPFNFHHFFGRYYYKVITRFSNGTEKEVLPVFKEDGITDFFGESGFILRPRVFQDKITVVQHVANCIAYGKRVDPVYINILNKMIQLNIKNSENQDIQSVSIYAKPIIVPSQFSGNVRIWENLEWCELYKYEKQSNMYKFVQIPLKLDFSDFKDLTKNQIEFNP